MLIEIVALKWQVFTTFRRGYQNSVFFTPFVSARKSGTLLAMSANEWRLNESTSGSASGTEKIGSA